MGVLRIGRLVGLWARRSGVARSTARGAQVSKPGDVPQPEPRLRPMIATQGMQIGWLAGQSPRRSGAVTMRARAAHRRPEDAREHIRFVCREVVRLFLKRWRTDMLQRSDLVCCVSS